MCPAFHPFENPGDAIFPSGDESAAAADGGSTPDAAASGDSSDSAPDYAPTELTILVPLTEDPYIVEDGGMPDWLIAAALNRVTENMRNAEQEEWSLSNCDTEEDE